MDETPKQKDKRKLKSPGTNSSIYKHSKMPASPDQADSNSHLDGLSTRMDLMFDHYWILWKKDGLRQMMIAK